MIDSPQPPARPYLSTATAVAVFGVVFLSEHAGNLYEIVRMPVVRARLLADHPAAWLPALGAAICLFAAIAVDRHTHPPRRLVPAVEAAVLLYAIVMLHWFLRLGWSGWGAGGDWQKDGVYYQTIADAIRSVDVPYYISSLQQGTERFFANLETPLAPHAVLLALLPPGGFYLLHLTACVIAGFVAARALRDHLQLSLAWWTIWVLLLVMNGNILSHLSAGHTQWAGCFLLPWVFLVMLRVQHGERTRDLVTLALTWGAMIIIGSWHVFVWSLILWLTFVLTRPSIALFTVRAALLAAALSAYRLLPAVLTFGTGSNAFIGGYDSIGQLVASLVGAPEPTPPLQLHEYDSFIGWAGFAVLCLALVPRKAGAAYDPRRLWAASIVLIILSMHPWYEWTLFNLPGFVSQRVATRMAMVGVLGLLLIGCARLTELVPRHALRSPMVLAAALIATGWFATELALHAEALRPAVMVPGAMIGALKSSRVETAYWWSLLIGAAVSVASILVVVRSKFWRR